MKKYRVVKLANGDYGIQKRRWLFWWKLLPMTSGYTNGAYAEIDRLIQKDEEQIKIKKGLKVIQVHRYDKEQPIPN